MKNGALSFSLVVWVTSLVLDRRRLKSWLRVSRIVALLDELLFSLVLNGICPLSWTEMLLMLQWLRTSWKVPT